MTKLLQIVKGIHNPDAHKTTTDTLPAEIDYIRRSRQSERLMVELAAKWGEGGRLHGISLFVLQVST